MKQAYMHRYFFVWRKNGHRLDPLKCNGPYLSLSPVLPLCLRISFYLVSARSFNNIKPNNVMKFKLFNCLFSIFCKYIFIYKTGGKFSLLAALGGCPFVLWDNGMTDGCQRGVPTRSNKGRVSWVKINYRAYHSFLARVTCLRSCCFYSNTFSHCDTNVTAWIFIFSYLSFVNVCLPHKQKFHVLLTKTFFIKYNFFTELFWENI